MTRRFGRISRALIGGVLLAGCALQTPAERPKVVRDRAVASRSPAVPPPGLSTSPAAAGGAQVLRRPSADSVAVKGRVAIDPGYVLANNGGSLLSNNGAGVLAAGQTRSSGGSLVANNGGGVIANNGGNIIANNGGGLIGNNSAARRLLDAPASTGALVPAAGMLVGARSLRTGQRLPVGVDDTGRPVFTVYSNLAGAFELYLPGGEAGNVLIETSVPDATDSRLAYDAIATSGSSVDQVVDDDSAVAARFVRSVLVRRLADFLVQPPELMRLLIAQHVTATLEVELTAVVEQIRAAAVAAGITADPAMAPAVWALAAACADEVLARIDLDAMVLDHAITNTWPRCQPRETVQAALLLVIRQQREQTAERLAEAPTFFEGQPYIAHANACKPGTYAIRRPADLPAFYVDEYLAPNRGDASDWKDLVLESVGATWDSQGVNNGIRLDAASNSLTAAFMTTFSQDREGGRSALLSRIAGFRPGEAVPAGAPTPGLPACPLPSVSTLPYPSPGERGRPLVGPSCPPAPVTPEHVAAVTQLYRDVLGREPDADWGAVLAQSLADGRSLATHRREMANSDESRQRVFAALQTTLGRDPTDGERDDWIGRLATDTTFAEFLAALEKQQPAAEPT